MIRLKFKIISRSVDCWLISPSPESSWLKTLTQVASVVTRLWLCVGLPSDQLRLLFLGMPIFEFSMPQLGVASWENRHQIESTSSSVNLFVWLHSSLIRLPHFFHQLMIQAPNTKEVKLPMPWTWTEDFDIYPRMWRNTLVNKLRSALQSQRSPCSLQVTPNARSGKRVRTEGRLEVWIPERYVELYLGIRLASKVLHLEITKCKVRSFLESWGWFWWMCPW